MASKKQNLKKKLNSKKSSKKQIGAKSKHISYKNKKTKKTTNVNKNKITNNVNSKQKNLPKEPQNKEIAVKEIVKKTKLKSRISGFIKYLNKIKKYLLISFFITIIAVLVLFKFKDTTQKIFLTFKSYTIGEKVVLNDNSEWYVIEESSSEENVIKLLSANIIDLNNDGKIDDKDKLAFDSSNSCIYDSKNDKNIGYFLEKKFIEKFDNLNGKIQIRLLSSEEYILVRNAMNFGYSWKEGNWLASNELKSWWLETSNFNKIYVVTERGSYKLSKPSTKNYIRPVMIINKENIK